MAETNKARASRDSETHDKQARRRPWRPVRKLETPPAPPGYTFRWIRESMLGPRIVTGKHAKRELYSFQP